MRKVVCALGWVLLAAVLAGCGADKGFERYVPAPEDARRALETALTAWQDGKPAGPITDTTPGVAVADTTRRPGQTLRSFRVLGEVSGNGPRCFAVRLELDNPAETQTARYVVVGIDPLWVFRQEDYDRLAHWEHPMDEGDKGKSAAKE
jgi:hypothetical protein